MHSQEIAYSYHWAYDITALTDVDVAANMKRIHLRALDANWETCRILQGIGLYITNSQANVWIKQRVVNSPARNKPKKLRH